MRGSVVKKRDRWYIVYYVGKKPNGKWKQKWEGSWETKKEAEKVLRSRITDIEDSFERKYDNSTLQSYLKYWIATYCTERLAPNTLRGYKVNVEKHIIPYIGKIRLNQLRPADIQKLYSSLLLSGLSPTSVRYVHNNLRKALAIAVKQEIIPKNPADNVDPPIAEHYEATILSTDDVRRLLCACEGTEIFIPVLFALLLGLRRGEALGLQWQDIDWERKTVTINHSARFANEGIVLGTTKTKNSRRTLLLPDYAFRSLIKERQRQEAQKDIIGLSYNPLGLICCRDDGTPLTSSVLWHDFSEVLRKSNLPHVRFHDLRHTNATIMLKNAVPSKIVSSMLGHSSIGITLDIYSHVITEMQQNAVNVMDEIMNH